MFVVIAGKKQVNPPSLETETLKNPPPIALGNLLILEQTDGSEIHT